MTVPVKKLSDAELRSACAPTGVERTLDRLGCALAMEGAVACTLLLVAATSRFGVKLPVVALGVAWLVASAALFWVLSRMGGARRRPFREELSHRYGCSPSEAYMAEIREMLARNDAPDVVLMLTVRALPHGGHRWIQAIVWNHPTAHGRVDVRDVGHTGGEIESARCSRSSGELAEGSAGKLLGLLQTPGARRLSHLPPNVKDGLPCTITVVERRPPAEYTGTCNLAGLQEEHETHPSVTFARSLLALAADLDHPPLAYGACSFEGDITLGG